MGFWSSVKKGLGYTPQGALYNYWNSPSGDGPKSDVPGIDRNNFNLAGADSRGDFLRGGAQNAQTREAPQAQSYQAGASGFAGDQHALVDRLRGQMNGEDSLAQLQLRDATDANIAQQRSQAASGTPGNAAMLQRMAMQNTGKIDQGYNSQAAQLGIQERNAAANALGAVAGQARGQDQQQNQFNAGQQQQNSQFNVGATLQQRGQNDAYTQGMSALELENARAQQQGSMGYEQAQTTRRGQDLGIPEQPTRLQEFASIAGPLAMASDERLKRDVSTPDGGSMDTLIDRLRPHVYSYTDERLGAGPRLGVMAQDVERGGPVGRSMVGELEGAKVLDVPKSLGTALGLIGRLGERIDQLDGGGRGIGSRMKPSADAGRGVPKPPRPAPRRVLPGELAKHATLPPRTQSE
jgi:hypothetical protein